jgi:hypothetical protein
MPQGIENKLIVIFLKLKKYRKIQLNTIKIKLLDTTHLFSEKIKGKNNA